MSVKNDENNEKDLAGKDPENEEVNFEPENGLGDVGTLQAKINKLKLELANCKSERMEYLDGWQRCKADSINSRREILQRAEREGQRGKHTLIEDIIPAFDSFDMARQGEAWEKMDPAWRNGIDNVNSQLEGALRLHGVEPFGKKGDVFDPYIHEAIKEEKNDSEPGTITSVLRRGWRAGETIIRPAQVIVSAKTVGN